MIRALALTAAAALALTAAPAFAQEAETAQEAELEAAAEAFAARMEAFGEEASAAAEGAADEAEADARIAAIWARYAPAVSAFAASTAAMASQVAAAAMAEVDVDAIVDEALNDPEVQAALRVAPGVARNGAWAQNDPEQAITYGLIAEYAMHQAMDAAGDGDDGVVVEIDPDAAGDPAHR